MIKRGDWVTHVYGYGMIGFVNRVAADGAWADVKWKVGEQEWVKRMNTKNLTVQHTINCGELTVTDMTRETELQGGDRV